MNDSFSTRYSLTVNGADYTFFMRGRTSRWRSQSTPVS